MPIDGRQALQELRDYFEQMRNKAIREKASGDGKPDTRLDVQAECYDHALSMVISYQANSDK